MSEQLRTDHFMTPQQAKKRLLSMGYKSMLKYQFSIQTIYML